jgi:hypothetical protein
LLLELLNSTTRYLCLIDKRHPTSEWASKMYINLISEEKEEKKELEEELRKKKKRN